MMEKRRYSDRVLLKRLFFHARPYWLHLVFLFCLNLVATPLALLTPWPLKLVVDHVIGARPLPRFISILIPDMIESSHSALLVMAVVMVVLVALLIDVQAMLSWMLQTYIGEKLVLSFRSRLFRHVQRLSLLYHDKKGHTDSVYKIQYDAPSIQWVLVYGVGPFITAAFTLTGMVFITRMINGKLACVALAVSPVLFSLAEYYRRRIRTRWSEIKDVESSTLSVLQETLGALRVVKAFGREEHQYKSYVSRAKQSIHQMVKLSFLDGGFMVLIGITIASGSAIALWIGVKDVRAGLMSIGDLLIVLAYLAQIYTPLKTLSHQMASVQKSLASSERVFALLDEVPDVIDPPHGRSLSKARGKLAFQHVAFEYEKGSPVLADIDFEVEPGKVVGIMGRSGAGKTTLVSLLIRFFDSTQGKILLDNWDIREYRLADLRNQFAFVLQEPVLFSSSIQENIAYAKPLANEKEIIQAAKAADAHDFIMKLPDGYQTLVGERGMRLSGGERQRISLARAFLKDAPILILDEPTSSVDTETEGAIMRSMDQLMSGRTTFIIAHRLSTLEKCDIKINLENGRIVNLTHKSRT